MIDTSHLQIRTHEQAGVPVVSANGDVDLCTTATLRAALEQVCSQQHNVGALAIDIREVAFIDSAGLALLVEMRKRFLEKCPLTLVIAPGSQPERVLRLGRFDTFLRVCYTLEEATNAA